MRKALVPLTFLLLALGLGAAPVAIALPACEGPVFQKTLYGGQGVLESAAIGGGGKLFVSGTDGSSENALLRRYGAPGRKPQRIAAAGPGPGGLAWAGKRLLWGNGNTQANGLIGDETPSASLYSVNPATRGKRRIADSLGMANGIARTKRGEIFASNAAGTKLDRISASGETTNGWASVSSANGLAISPNGKYLFANQTLSSPSTIARIEIAHPENVTSWFTADTFGGLDGLTRDEDGNLYAAAWLAGQVWKITRDRQACVLATDIPQVSNLVFGVGKKRFSRGQLYAVNFAGDIVQIKGARRATVPAS